MMKYYLKISLPATALALTFFISSSHFAAAEGIQEYAESGSKKYLCESQITFPQGKEELSIFDVEQAVKQHFVRIGSPKISVEANWAGDEFISVDIFDQRGMKLRHMLVDAATTNIIHSESEQLPVGFASENGPEASLKDNPETAARDIYRIKLRRHMLGDGKPWASWIQSPRSIACFDDYRFGIPEINSGS